MVLFERGRWDLTYAINRIIKSKVSTRELFYCASDFQWLFFENDDFSNLKIYIFLHFLSNHPEAFRMFSAVDLEQIAQIEIFI